MLQSFEVLLKGGFFKGALPEAAFWGRIALGVGVAGFVASVLLVLLHLRDQASLISGESLQGSTARLDGDLSINLLESFSLILSTMPLSARTRQPSTLLVALKLREMRLYPPSAISLTRHCYSD